jgi:hypothetical protein
MTNEGWAANFHSRSLASSASTRTRIEWWRSYTDDKMLFYCSSARALVILGLIEMPFRSCWLVRATLSESTGECK